MPADNEEKINDILSEVRDLRYQISLRKIKYLARGCPAGGGATCFLGLTAASWFVLSEQAEKSSPWWYLGTMALSFFVVSLSEFCPRPIIVLCLPSEQTLAARILKKIDSVSLGVERDNLVDVLSRITAFTDETETKDWRDVNADLEKAVETIDAKTEEEVRATGVELGLQ